MAGQFVTEVNDNVTLEKEALTARRSQPVMVWTFGPRGAVRQQSLRRAGRR